jgi:hypothetical protein
MLIRDMLQVTVTLKALTGVTNSCRSFHEEAGDLQTSREPRCSSSRAVRKHLATHSSRPAFIY